MNLVKVTNIGKKPRSRIGVTFKPDEPVEMEVSSRDYLVLNSVKSLHVEKLEGKTEKNKEDPEQDTENTDDEESEEYEGSGEVEKIEDSDIEHEEESDELTEDQIKEMQDQNIENFMKYVEEGAVPIEKAIEIEEDGKNRKTLIDELESMKEES